ncbi:unnamed protein product [Prorocentrum cordatum]|uniref:Protein xylosyltransferase n=1 Tax=Prorocentrum cordatum TaxID=2364126 RepID=A0ABN9WF87_9DINO|nr:unnamed protein product [Polarella glacialis]
MATLSSHEKGEHGNGYYGAVLERATAALDQDRSERLLEATTSQQPVAAAAPPAAAAAPTAAAPRPPPAAGASPALSAAAAARHCRAPAAGEAAPAPMAAQRGSRAVGASIAVHPPRFYAVAQFLRELAACPAAAAALRVFLVFSERADLELFGAALRCLEPDVPVDIWEPVVADAPLTGKRVVGKFGMFESQFVAAYKKWYGIAHMMDLDPDEAPEYGLMLDAELLLFELHAPPGHQHGCFAGSGWEFLLDRIRSKEASKEWPAAQVSSTLKVYKTGDDMLSGKDFDRKLINGNARFVTKGAWRPDDDRKCRSEGCGELRRQWRDALFSWWTDLPWMNLSVARRMLRHLADAKPAEEVGGGAARMGREDEEDSREQRR